jgi:nitroimidazol reductase NimA-like FMN-containing flavoprotein (pyridoxamine 5'-phosphate oxidase superfamily)
VRADGSPSVVPVWFIFEAGKVLITPRKHSAFLANLQREPRVAITIDEDQGRYRKVMFESNAEVLYEVGEDRQWDAGSSLLQSPQVRSREIIVRAMITAATSP